MILWLVLGAMTALALALLLWPLARRAGAVPERGEYDIAVYRDQLAELERDMDRGLLAADEADAARAEIGRRMLSAAEDGDGTARRGSGAGMRRWGVATLVVMVPAVAALVYLRAGVPGLADRPAARVDTAQAPPEGDAEIEGLIARLAERLQEQPDDVDGWALMGRTLYSMRRFAAAARAFERASELAPANTALLARQVESLTFASGGTVTPRAHELLARALAADASEVRARYYLGLADLQAGRRRAALDRWLALEQDAPPDAPWLATLRPRLERLAGELGLDLAALREPRSASATGGPRPGPTAGDVEAAAKMLDADRQVMIRSMVSRLAARLDAAPDDADGWLRLARSYRVLGEAAKAREAHARAAALRPRDIGVLIGYANSLLKAAAPGAPPPAELGAVVDRIRAIDPDDANGLWLAGLAARADGRTADAAMLWRRLLSGLEPGSDQHAAITRRIEALEGK